jgi:hypothetical protein
MRRVAHAFGLAVTVVVLAGTAACAGGDSNYELRPTQECLREAGVAVDTTEIDVVARTTEGALHATFPGNEVTVSFGEDVEDAARAERAYRRFAPERLRPRLDHVLKRRRNAVLIWGVAPTPTDETRVLNCLSA